ncbi:MAG: tetratricopeptide repeat protein [Bryobacteraceae bacterium]
MRFIKPLVCLTLIPVSAFAQKREIIEMQRTVAALEDQVRTLQSTVNEQLVRMTTLLQQTLDGVNKTNTSVAVLDSQIRDRLAEQSKSVAAPVASLSSKLDQMTTEFQTVRESVADLSGRMSKLQTQLTDLGNTIKIMQTPAAPPPPGGTSGPPPGMSATQLLDTAKRDRSGGNLDLALQGFETYLQHFGDTPLAPEAQFYIGQIHYDKGEFQEALAAFDAVLERYPENSHTPDATYMKGMALLKSGQASAAGKEFLNVIQKHPKSDVAPKAIAARKALGLSTPSARKPR